MANRMASGSGEFGAADSPRDTPVVAGVYFLFKEGALTYVGQSGDCYGRIAKHRQNGRGFDLATVMPLKTEFITQVERALIQGFRPPGNITHNIIVASAATPPMEPPKRRPRPQPDSLGLISKSRARQLASSYGVQASVLEAAIASGELKFTSKPGAGPGGTHTVALYAEAEAFCQRKQTERLQAIGFKPSPILSPNGSEPKNAGGTL